MRSGASDVQLRAMAARSSLRRRSPSDWSPADCEFELGAQVGHRLQSMSDSVALGWSAEETKAAALASDLAVIGAQPRYLGALTLHDRVIARGAPSEQARPTSGGTMRTAPPRSRAEPRPARSRPGRWGKRACDENNLIKGRFRLTLIATFAQVAGAVFRTCQREFPRVRSVKMRG